jgi:AraC-like DNA-binding protein
MNYQTYRPDPRLAPYIKCYWTLAYDYGHSRDRIFPDGCMELIFHFGDLFRKHNPDQSFFKQPRSFIHGQLNTYMEIEATGKADILGVRFHPAGLRHFTEHGLHEIAGDNISITEFWGANGDILEDRMLHAPDIQQRIALLEDFLLLRCKGTADKDTLSDRCVAIMLRTEGRTGIDRIARELNIGRRQLERRFIESVGISPKVLSRITRFQHTLQLIEDRKFASFTHLAYEGGFYDQAHFIRDFKTFTGLRPMQYFAHDLALIKHFSFT